MLETIELRRKLLTPTSTIGELYGPNAEFFAHTLEDPCRKVKVNGKTAIPAGEYEVIIGWSQKYQRLMPRLLSVPFFDGILIHPGNDAWDTEGCVLVGRHDPAISDFVGQSRDTFDRIFPIIRKLTEHGKLVIRVEGGFPAAEWERVDALDIREDQTPLV